MLGVPALTLPAPAKLNLFLAITGRRADGFHDLVSVVAPIELGDSLTVELREPGAAPRFELTCDSPEVPTDDSNLVLRAAHAFVAATEWKGGAVFRLEKRVPMGAGLGGGSSDGVAALRALNRLTGNPLGPAALTGVAASVGSDCPLFLQPAPVVMRGRGERIEPLPSAAAARLGRRRVLVFKPAFSVATAWAYRRMAEMAVAEDHIPTAPAPRAAGRQPVYLAAAAAEQRLAAWMADPAAPAEALLYNNLERPVFGKHIALPALLERLRGDFGLEPRMTGSGSACFALLPEDAPVADIRATIHEAWGKSAYVLPTRLA